MHAELVILTEEGLYVRPNDTRYIDFYTEVRDWAAGNPPTRTFEVTHADFAQITPESMQAAVSAIRNNNDSG